MSRISGETLCRAIGALLAMDGKQKAQLCDEIFRAQPHLFGSFLVQKRLGVSVEKMAFLLNLLFLCFQAMKESGMAWPLISEDELDRQVQRYAACVKLGDDLSKKHRAHLMKQYIEAHPEKELFAYVHVEMANWLKRIVPEETDKYVMLAAANFVNCIAFVPMNAPGTKADIASPHAQ